MGHAALPWNALWELWPDRKRVGGGWEPPLPLILAAWDDTPDMLKMHRLAEHIEWAAGHGALESITVFLRGLRVLDAARHRGMAGGVARRARWQFRVV